jgi:hypothetical protein
MNYKFCTNPLNDRPDFFYIKKKLELTLPSFFFQIKVEPPDIRDIDEEEPSGWESPKLIIDLVS